MAGNDPNTKIIITAKDEASDVFDGLKTKLTGVAGAIGAAFAADQLIDFARAVAPVADAAANLEGRLRLAVGESGNLSVALDDVRTSANAAGADINSVGQLYGRIAESTRDLGYSQANVADLTDTINKSFAVSGTSASAASGAITQLAQAFASGALRGDEFNSVNEAAPRLMQALADGLGVARGELRKMAEEGKLTTEVVLQALQSQKDAIERDFVQMPDTVGRATQRMSNEWQVFVGEFAKSTGTFEVVADGLSAVAANLDEIAGVAATAGEVIVAALAVKAAAALRGYVTQISVSAAATTAQAVALDGLALAGRAATAAVLTLGKALPGLAIAGVVAGVAALVVEFVRAKSAAEAGEEAVRKMLEDQPTNNAAKQIRLVATEAESARFKLSEMELAFGEMRSKGMGAAEALESIIKTANLADTDGITALVTGLDALRAGAQVTGEQIEVSLAERLRKMTSGELQEFGVQADMAFSQGRISAEQLATTLDSQARAAFQKLGIDAGAALTGMSAKFTEASGALQVVVGQFDRLRDSGVDAGAAVSKALDAAIKAASNPKELEHLNGVVESLGKEGKLAGENVTRALEEIRKRADAATPGIDSVTEAFRELGVVTDKTLNEAAGRAREAFERIRDSGTASARELQQAFEAYAEKAIEANDGVASWALKAEAAQYGLKAAATETGQIIVQSMTEAAAATAQIGEQAKAATQDLQEMGQAAMEASDLVKSAQAANENVSAAGHGDWSDWSPQEFRRALDGAYGPAAQQGAREWVSRQQQGSSSGDREPTAAPRPTSGTASTPSSSGMRYEVAINMGGRTRVVNTASDADAVTLIDTLHEIGRRS